MEHLLRDIKDIAVGSLSTRLTTHLHALKGLNQRLEEIAQYVGKVADGTMQMNPQIIYNLQDVLSHTPNLSSEELVRSFSIKTNDEMLSIYVSSILRSVIALHNLINNKVANREAELKLASEVVASEERSDAKKNSVSATE